MLNSWFSHSTIYILYINMYTININHSTCNFVHKTKRKFKTCADSSLDPDKVSDHLSDSIISHVAVNSAHLPWRCAWRLSPSPVLLAMSQQKASKGLFTLYPSVHWVTLMSSIHWCLFKTNFTSNMVSFSFRIKVTVSWDFVHLSR